MEHNTSSVDKKIYVAIAVAIVALIIGAVGLIVGVTGQDKTVPTPSSKSQPGGTPGPRDTPLYQSQGSSDAQGEGTVKQNDNN